VKIKQHERGFSILELLIVIAIITLVAGISVFNIVPALRQVHVNTAETATQTTLTLAREKAIAERRVYLVSFNLPGTITITQSATGLVVQTATLPPDVVFSNLPGIPSTALTTPDGFGTGAAAIDFDIGVGPGGVNTVYFYPDGSARDINGRLSNGVVYLARPGELMSSRAVTVFGITGRIRGWRLLQTGAGVRYWGQL
jgi:prepilin-type N-terminal cleavage/methylation domain-containing protein